MQKASLSVLMLGFVAIGLLEWATAAGREHNGWYTLDHYLYGLMLPIYFYGLFSAPDKSAMPMKGITFWLWRALRLEKLRPWAVKLVQPFGDGFWLGVFITEAWSIRNELLVYWFNNPRHGADWHHWGADALGIASAWAIRRWIEMRTPG